MWAILPIRSRSQKDIETCESELTIRQLWFPNQMETKNQSSNSVVEQITTKSINLSCGLMLNLIEEQLTS